MAVYPVLFQKGPITIYTYGVCVAIALIIGRYAISQYAYKSETPIFHFVFDNLIWMMLCLLVGSRLFFVLENLHLFRSNFFQIFALSQGGLSFFGGFIFVVTFLIITVRRQPFSFLQIFDLISPAVALGHSIGRIGCYFAGCCGGSLPFMPVQLCSSLVQFLIFVTLIFVRFFFKPQKYIGLTSGTYLFLHGLFRFTIEFYRSYHDPVFYSLRMHQWMSLVMILVGTLFIIRSFCRKASS